MTWKQSATFSLNNGKQDGGAGERFIIFFSSFQTYGKPAPFLPQHALRFSNEFRYEFAVWAPFSSVEAAKAAGRKRRWLVLQGLLVGNLLARASSYQLRSWVRTEYLVAAW